MTESSKSEVKPGATEEHQAQTGNTSKSAAAESTVKNRNKPTSVSQDVPGRKAQRKVSKPGKAEVSRTTARRVNPLLWVLALTNFLILIIYGIAGGYFWYSSKQSEQQQALELQQSLVEAQQVISAENKTLIAQFSQQTATENTQFLQQVNAGQQLLQQQFNDLKSDINEVTGNRHESQLAAEVQYLVRMAARKVVIEQNGEHAVYLLSEALNLLNDTQDPNNFRLRELLSQDLTQLSVKKLRNNDDLLLQLNTLLASVQGLTFAIPEQVFGQEQQKPSGDIAEWRQNLGILWDNFTDDFLSWEVMDAPLQPYLNLQQQELVRGMMQYHILSARHAVLARDAALYQLAIQQLVTLISKFDTEASQTQVFRHQLDALVALSVKQEITFELKSFQYLQAGQDEPVKMEATEEEAESTL